MDEDFDDFGNFVGQEYSDSGSGGEDSDWEDTAMEQPDEVAVEHFAHDTQSLSEPLVMRRHSSDDEEVTPSNWEFQSGLLRSTPALVRNLCIRGPQGSGKTALLKLLGCPAVYSAVEAQRQTTLYPRFYSALVQSSTRKSYVFNCADTPGHVEFIDFAECAKALCDASVYVVDVVEGVFPRQSVELDNTLVVVNKIDRLITELKLPPSEACARIFTLLGELGVPPDQVIFASARFTFTFSLGSITRLYARYDRAVPDLRSRSAFTQYVLEPLYTLVSCALVGQCECSDAALQAIGIRLSRSEWCKEFDIRIRLVLSRYFECDSLQPFVDSVIELLPPPGSVDVDTPLVIEYRDQLYGVCRSSVPQIRPGLLFPYAGTAVKITESFPSSWYMTVYDGKDPFKAVLVQPYVRVSIEPMQDTPELAQNLNTALAVLSALFPALQTKSEENGQFELLAMGELYLDTVIFELKQRYTGKLKVGQPLPLFQETVSSRSTIDCACTSPNGKFRIVVIAEPLSRGISSTSGAMLDAFKSNRLFAEPHIRLDPSALDAMIQGFQWSCMQGPLMDEPVTDVQFTVLEVETKAATAQILPTMRKACLGAVMLAAPRICQPVSKFSCIGLLASGKAVYKEVEKRGGEVVADEPVPLTNLYVVEATLPTIDTFTLGVDVLCHMDTRRQARVAMGFDHWHRVDGDPLDAKVSVPRLEPSEPEAFARDVVLKTRWRKGIHTPPDVRDYIDADVAEILFGF